MIGKMERRNIESEERHNTLIIRKKKEEMLPTSAYCEECRRLVPVSFMRKHKDNHRRLRR